MHRSLSRLPNPNQLFLFCHVPPAEASQEEREAEREAAAELQAEIQEARETVSSSQFDVASFAFAVAFATPRLIGVVQHPCRRARKCMSWRYALACTTAC